MLNSTGNTEAGKATLVENLKSRLLASASKAFCFLFFN